MNGQFHTPSFGDEVFDLSLDFDTNATTTTAMTTHNNYYLQNNEATTVDNNNFKSDACQISVQKFYSQYQQKQQQDHYLESKQLSTNSDDIAAAESKRIRGMDLSMDEYNHSGINDETATTTINAMTGGGGGITSVGNSSNSNVGASGDAGLAKPLSAYALFFKDTVTVIKQTNPACTYQELSKIVASMWESLDEEHKKVYVKRHEEARMAYLLKCQQQQTSNATTTTTTTTSGLQTKPLVFTIATNNSNNNNNNKSNNNNNNNNTNEANYQQQMLRNTTSTTQQQQQQQQLMTKTIGNNLISTTTTAATTTTGSEATTTTDASNNQQETSQENSQSPTETLANDIPQICTRDSCNKPAIISPDWEDEYCSNECVIIHCRNVFNSWVQENLLSRKK